MSDRYFELKLAGYGATISIGTVNRDFVEYWAQRGTECMEASEELDDYIGAIGWNSEPENNKDCPPITDDFVLNEFYLSDLEDIYYGSGAYADNLFYVNEVRLVQETDCDYPYWVYEPMEGKEEIPLSVATIRGSVGREMYTQGNDPNPEYTPVFIKNDAEKGSFGSIFIRTDGEDFDPMKLVLLTVETDCGEIVEGAVYDAEELEINYDFYDTRGKGTWYYISYCNEMWLDHTQSENCITELFEDE